MKKIVALALCLVLALSLCATAFAATTVDTGKTATALVADTHGYKIIGYNDTTAVASKSDITTFIAKQTKTVTGDDGKVTTTIVPDCYVVTGTNNGYYYVCDDEIANYRLVKNDVVVCYLNKVSSELTYANMKGEVAAFSGASTNTACETYKDSGYTYSKVDYKADENGTVYGTVAGKLARWGAAAAGYNDHTFYASGVSYKGTDANSNLVPVSVKCADCGKTYEVVKTMPLSYTGNYSLLKNIVSNSAADATKTFATGTYANYVVLTGSTTAAGTTAASTAAVSSAKTFDAGIALYVGMSISAVAGSAVVIGKKKEF